MKENEFSYEEWLKSVPDSLTGDPLWRMKVYRLALFVADLGWHDVTQLSKDRRTWKLSDQLYAALGSIGVNIAEGYSRSSGKDRARLYEYALGSARESRNWYFNARHLLGHEVALHRMRLLTHIIRLLLKIIPEERTRMIREAEVQYRVNLSNMALDEDTEDLLSAIPLPAP